MYKNLAIPTFRFINQQRFFIFPILIAFFLFLGTVFGINGSSLGVYDYLLGQDAKKQLLVGEPRTIRSDEWVVNSPFVLAQTVDNFPTFNTNVAAGQDMSVIVDVPYKDWSVIFRPQNLIFFILPLEQAFAFKWWFLAWILMLSVYLFVLLILPRRYLAASLLAIFMCFSPFIQWWYQSITILPIAFGLLLLVIASRLLQYTSVKKNVLYGSLLSYLVACFFMVMYPAFQVAVGLVLAGLFLGIYLSGYRFSDLWHKKFILKLLGFGIVGLVPVVLFYIGHHDVIKTVQDTVYPGARNVLPGGMQFVSLLTWPLSYTLLQGGPATIFGGNQSEESRFLFFGLLLIPYLCFYFYKNKAKANAQVRTLKFVFVGLFSVFLLFLTYAFIPINFLVYKLLGLNLVPHMRLLIGFGLINLVLIAIALGLPAKKYKGLKSILDRTFCINVIWAGAATCCGLLLVKRTYGLHEIGPIEIIFVPLYVGLVVGMLTSSIQFIRYTGLSLAVIMSMGMSILVNPLYKGLGSIINSSFAHEIRVEEKNNNSYWIVSDKLGLDSVPLANGAEVFSGVQTYPQLTIWNKYFSKQDYPTFNRYAHVKFNVDDQGVRSIKILGQDSFEVSVPSCDPMLKELNIHYIVANSSIKKSYDCFQKIDEFSAQGAKIGIFKRY